MPVLPVDAKLEAAMGDLPTIDFGKQATGDDVGFGVLQPGSQVQSVKVDWNAEIWSTRPTPSEQVGQILEPGEMVVARATGSVLPIASAAVAVPIAAFIFHEVARFANLRGTLILIIVAVLAILTAMVFATARTVLVTDRNVYLLGFNKKNKTPARLVAKFPFAELRPVADRTPVGGERIVLGGPKTPRSRTIYLGRGRAAQACVEAIAARCAVRI